MWLLSSVNNIWQRLGWYFSTTLEKYFISMQCSNLSWSFFLKHVTCILMCKITCCWTKVLNDCFLLCSDGYPGIWKVVRPLYGHHEEKYSELWRATCLLVWYQFGLGESWFIGTILFSAFSVWWKQSEKTPINTKKTPHWRKQNSSKWAKLHFLPFST